MGVQKRQTHRLITYLETEHCPCDKQMVKECREHYFRGWQQSNETKTKNLIKFAKRLDEKQTSLTRDGIIIANEKKKLFALDY